MLRASSDASNATVFPISDRLQLSIEPVVLSYSLSSQFDQIGIVIVGLLSYQSLCDLDTHRGNQP